MQENFPKLKKKNLNLHVQSIYIISQNTGTQIMNTRTSPSKIIKTLKLVKLFFWD